MPTPGSVWKAGTWKDDAWAANTWAEAQEATTSVTGAASWQSSLMTGWALWCCWVLLP